MKRLERLTAAITLLQSRKFVPLAKMKQQFGVSERTLYRDLGALQESGVPIGFQEGKGYFLVEGFALPPVSFTEEESATLVLAQNLINRYGDEKSIKNFTSLLTKIRAVLKEGTRDQVDDWEGFIRTYVPPGKELGQNKINRAGEACRKGEVLQLTYTTFSKEESIRKIEPIGLTFYGNTWHLIAWCQWRTAYRDFRMDRIQKLESTGRFFNKTERLTIDQYIHQLEENLRNLDPQLRWIEGVS